MILFFNVRITSEPSAHFTQHRGNLPHYTNYDIFRYTLASYTPLVPLLSKVIIYVKLDNEFAGREAELEEFINDLFPKDKLSIYWYRNNSTEEFRQATKELDAIGDDIIWFQGNHDHPFIDNDLLTIESAVRHLQEDPDPMATFWYSHWPEFILNCSGSPLTEDRRLIKFHYAEHCSIKIVKRAHWDWYWYTLNRDGFLFRFDNFGWPNPPAVSSYVPIKEVCRHFDGYSHVHIGLDLVPPLAIPPKFFTKDMVIRYGYADRNEDCININPAAPNLYGNDINSPDYKLGLDEIPLFWKSRIKYIDINPDANLQALDVARNQNIVARTNILVHGHRRSNLPIEYYSWRFI